MNWYKIAKKEDKFVYDDLIKNFWRELLLLEKDRVDMAFDLENNDSVGKSKDFEVDKIFTTIGGAKYKYKVTAQMMSAGGDWENPIRYFKCQCAGKTEIRDEWGKYRKGKLTFIYIPENSDGNEHLIKGDKKKWIASTEESEYQKLEDKELWDALKKHCPKRIKAYYDDKYAEYDTDTKELIKDHGIYDEYDLVRVFGD